MILTILHNLLRILLFAAIFAVEVSVAIPVVSVLYLVLAAQKERTLGKVFLLTFGSLVVSSLLGIQWSVVVGVILVVWHVVEQLHRYRLGKQSITLITTVVLAASFALAARTNFEYKTILYTLISLVVAIVISRAFWPQRLRHTVIDWIAPTRE